MPWSATLSSALPSWVFLMLMTTRVRSGEYATAFSSRLRSAVTSRSSSPRTDRPRLPTVARVMPRALAFIRQRSTASATAMSSSTGRGSGTGSTAWIRDSVIRSWTRLVSRCASWRILLANRRTASGSSAASSIVSASSASAPTGVLSSWLVLATKSRLTSSTRRLSVWSSASTSTSPPPPTAPPSGATRTAKLVVRPPHWGTGTSNSPSRISPSRRTWRARAASSVTISRSPFTRPNARAAELARNTRSLLSTTTAEEGSTDSTDAMPGGSRVGGWVARDLGVRDVRVLAAVPLALVLIATRTPISLQAPFPQAKALTSEDSHTLWYALAGQPAHRDANGRAIFEACSHGGNHPAMSRLPAGLVRRCLAALVLDGLGRLRGSLRVQVPAAGGQRLEGVVELVDQGDAGRDVQRRDVLVADLVQVLDQGAQRVAVRHDQDRAAGPEVGHDLVVPVRQHPGQHVLEALGTRPGLGRQDGVARVGRLGELVVVGDRRRRDVVGTAPEHELLVTELGPGLGFVFALQGAVMPLVQPPGPPDREPEQARLVQGDVGRLDGPRQDRGVHRGRPQPGLGQQLAAGRRLLLPGRGQAHVHPPGEQALGV